MSGLAAKYLVLNDAGSLIPAAAMSQLQEHFLGRVADPLEVIVSTHSLPSNPFLQPTSTGTCTLLLPTGRNSS